MTRFTSTHFALSSTSLTEIAKTTRESHRLTETAVSRIIKVYHCLLNGLTIAVVIAGQGPLVTTQDVADAALSVLILSLSIDSEGKAINCAGWSEDSREAIIPLLSLRNLS